MHGDETNTDQSIAFIYYISFILLFSKKRNLQSEFSINGNKDLVPLCDKIYLQRDKDTDSLPSFNFLKWPIFLGKKMIFKAVAKRLSDDLVK